MSEYLQSHPLIFFGLIKASMADTDTKEALNEVLELLKDDSENQELLQMKKELDALLTELPSTNPAHQFEESSQTVIGPKQPSEYESESLSQSFDLEKNRRNSLDHKGSVKPPRERFYTKEPNFAELAEKDDRLAPFVRIDQQGRGQINFKDPDASRELTRSLLKHDFGINWDLEEGQLIPAVTNRINYIHWLEDLLALSSPSGSCVTGLDIGCGANLIYCLLGASVLKWNMTGLDITEAALKGSQRNLEANPHLKDLINLSIRISPSGQPNQGVIGPILKTGASFTFCMCNPPFFESLEESQQNPLTAFQGTKPEMVCEGGELEFVRQIVRESRLFERSIYWFTTMLGKKSTLRIIRQELHKLNVMALRVTEFVQGKTLRWGIAWSFFKETRDIGQKRMRTEQAGPVVLKKNTVIMLKSAKEPPQKILQQLRQYLETCDFECVPDKSGFGFIAEKGGTDLQIVKKKKTEQRDVKEGGGFSIAVSIACERKNVYALRAKIPPNSGEEIARQFTEIMADAEANLREVLGIKE